MSLPVSLMTDCGGLLNRRSPGRKRYCHTDALHAGYHVYSSHGWFLSRIIEFANWFFSHGASRRVTVLLSRICEFFFTRNVTDGHGLFTRVFFLSRIIEFANWFIHTENHGESRSYCPEFANLRIFLHTENRGGHGLFTRVFFFVPRLVLWTH